MESKETPKAVETPYKAFATEAEFNSYIQDLQSKSDAQKQFEKLQQQNEKMKNEFEKLKNEKSEIEKTFSTFQKQTVFEKKMQPFTSKIREDIPKPLVDTYLEKIRNEALESDDLESFDLESRFKDILKSSEPEKTTPEKKGTGVPTEKQVSGESKYAGITDAVDLYQALTKDKPELIGTKELHFEMQKLRSELKI